jgi:tryptophan synthase beta chain
VRAGEVGSRTLKDAMNEALRDWVANVETPSTSSARSPARIPIRRWCATSSRDRRRDRAQMLEAEGRLPDAVIACVGGGSNAIGMFHPFLDDPSVRSDRRRGGGRGSTGKHAASLCRRPPGVLHGNRTYLLQDEDGQIIEAHSISAGLDYPGVGPEHSWLQDRAA